MKTSSYAKKNVEREIQNTKLRLFRLKAEKRKYEDLEAKVRYTIIFF